MRGQMARSEAPPSSFADAVPKAATGSGSSDSEGDAGASVSAVRSSLSWMRFGDEWWKVKPKDLPNPGSFDDIRNEIDGLLSPQQFFDGLQFKAFLAPSQLFNVGHAFDLGSKGTPNNYMLFTTYATNQLMLMSRLDLSGRVFGRMIYMHTPKLTSKVIADVGSEANSSRGNYELEYRGLDFCSQIKLMSDASFSLSYMQSITPNLSAGAEFAYISQHSVSTTTVALKYSDEKENATMNFTPGLGMLMMGYVRKLNAASSLATDFMFNIFSRESIASVGYRYTLKKANVTGICDSTGKVATVYEEKINPGLSLLLSGEADYPKKDFRFGIGFNIGA